MKNYLLTALAVLMLSVMNTADAQIGIKASGLYGTVYGESEVHDGDDLQSIGFAPGFNLGVFFRAGEGLVGFQGELLYEHRRTKSFVEFNVANVDLENKTSFNYVSVPLLATFNIGNLKPYIGLNLAYMVSAKGTRSGTIGSTTISDDDEIDYFDDPYEDGYFNRLEIGGNVGLMFDISDALYADLRLYHSFTDLTNNDYDNSIIDGSSREDSDRAVYFSLGLGFSLF